MQIRIGQTIEFVYQDKSGKISQRKIEVKGIRGDISELLDPTPMNYWTDY